MPNGRTAIVTDMGNLFTVRIDPSWKYAYLWGSPIGPKLSVMFLDYDRGFVERAAVRYADTDVIGRSEQIKTYMGTDSREITLLFQFHAQGAAGATNNRIGGATLTAVPDPTAIDSDGIQARDDVTNLASILDAEVMQPSKFLDALKYPLVTNRNLSVGPPRLLLTIGRHLTMRCIATAVEMRSLPPFDPDTLLPYRSEVEVTFTSVQDRVTAYNFDGPSRTVPLVSTGVLQGIDGPANPASSLGTGISGTPGSQATDTLG